MAEEERSPTGFKVVDRRLFAADGSRKEEIPVEGQKVESPPGDDRSVPREAPDTPRGPDKEDSPEFETLVSYLSTTAMFQLGLIPGPSGERAAADLSNAQRTIDLLDVLQEKTRGNLTVGESRLLEDVLYELRMNFVQLQKRKARKSK